MTCPTVGCSLPAVSGPVASARSPSWARWSRTYGGHDWGEHKKPQAKRSCLLKRLIPDSSRVFLDDVENVAFAAALRPVAD